MRAMILEIRKNRRSGVLPALPLAGLLGALYALANYLARADSLLKLPLPPMTILLTQLYGMICVLNLFAIVLAASTIWHIEHTGGALRRLRTLPCSLSRAYMGKFMLLAASLAMAIALQHAALAWLGRRYLPPGTFDAGQLVRFGLYALLTALPALAAMLLAAFLSENLWVPLGIGVVGFLSAMALATLSTPLALLHPFVALLKPAMAMSAVPDPTTCVFAACETAALLGVGLICTHRE